MLLSLAASVIVVLSFVGAEIRAQETPTQTGGIIIPARNLFSLEEGTVEAWVQLDFDPAEEVKSGFTARGQLIQFIIPASETDLGASFGVSCFSSKATTKSTAGAVGTISTGIRAAFVLDGKQVPHPFIRSVTDWGKNQWHHLAVTWWDGARLALYFDGKKVGEIKYPHRVIRDIPATAQLVIGSPIMPEPKAGSSGSNNLIVDELRVSSVARQPESLGHQTFPLQPDPYTLLLLDFDQLQASKKAVGFLLPPNVLAISDRPENVAVTDGRIVNGKTGQALAFSAQPGT